MYTTWVHFEYFDSTAKMILPSWIIVNLDFQLVDAASLHKVSDMIAKKSEHDQVIIDDWKILNANVIRESEY